MDVGDHALIRGLGTASPLVRPEASRSYCGRRRGRPQSVRREFPCRCPAPPMRSPMAGEWTRFGALRRLHRLHLAPDRPDNAANSRATALTATVSSLPRPARRPRRTAFSRLLAGRSQAPGWRHSPTWALGIGISGEDHRHTKGSPKGCRPMVARWHGVRQSPGSGCQPTRGLAAWITFSQRERSAARRWVMADAPRSAAKVRPRPCAGSARGRPWRAAPPPPGGR